MAAPPRDALGHVEPHNDPDIRDSDGLIRYINPDYHLVPDPKVGGLRLSTAAFSESNKPPGGMSVDLERLMIEDGLDSLSRLPTTDFGAVRFEARILRDNGHMVGSDALPENPYHASVWHPSKGKRQKERMMGWITWLKKPTGLS